MSWYNEVFRKLHFDMHTPAGVEGMGAGFDAGEFARRVEAAGAEAVCFFARSAYGWPHYPTEYGPAHPDLARDILGEATAACQARGIRVLAYVCFEVLPPPLVEAHPEWLMRNADGTPVIQSDRGIACLNGPMRRELLLPQVREIVRRYPVDGLFFDGFPALHTVCHCEHCARLFGAPIPAGGSPDWPRFLAWQRAWLREFMTEGGDAIHAIRPECLCGVNWLATCRYAEEPPPGIDYLTADYPVTVNCALETSYQLAAWAWRGIPCDVMNARMLHWWQDWTGRPAAALKTEFAAALARGGRLFLGDLLEPYSSLPDPDVMALAADAFAFARERESLARDATPVADLALLQSPTTHAARGRRNDRDEAALRGAFLGTLEGGWTAHILLEGDVAEHLGRYQTLVVAGQPVLAPEAAAAITRFVEAGGGLVVSGEPDPALAEVLGIRLLGMGEDALAYLRVPDGPAFWPAHERARPPLCVHGRPALVELAGATMLAPLVGLGPVYQIGARPPGEPTGYPALAEHRFGKGRAVYSAVPLAADFWQRGNWGARHVLNGLVALATLSPTVTVDAEATVEVALARKDGALLVHLLTYAAERRSGAPPLVERVPPLYDVEVRVRWPVPPASVRQEPVGRELAVSYADGRAIVTVPRVDLHTCLVVE